MSGIPEWASSGPALYAFLLFVIFCRAQGTYWLGRAAAAGVLAGENADGLRGALARWFDGPVPRRGARMLEKWGLIIIPLCFLTVGVQTAVNAGAGLVRMKWRTYTLAMIPGCIVWAGLYALGLLALWLAAIGTIAGNPIAWLAMAGLFVVAGLTYYLRRRREQSKCPMNVRDGEIVTVEDEVLVG